MLHNGKQLIVGMTFERRGAVAQHISVWQSIVRPDIKSYLILRVQPEFDDPCEVLFFNSQEAYDKFKTWWDEYITRFDGREYMNQIIPTIPDGRHISGWPLIHDTSKLNSADMRSKQFRDEWRWICEFTQDKVRINKEFWLFESEADMVMFKLKGKLQNEDEDDSPPF